MKTCWQRLLAVPVVIGLAIGCGGAGDADDPDGGTIVDDTPVVADSLLVPEIQRRIDADPRLDVEGVSVTVSSEGQNVMLHGEVPSRREAAIAYEIANSVLGVRRVLTDSLVVLADDRV